MAQSNPQDTELILRDLFPHGLKSKRSALSTQNVTRNLIRNSIQTEKKLKLYQGSEHLGLIIEEKE